jgi:hypothetical protein
MKKALFILLILSTQFGIAQKLPKIKGSKNVVISERKFDSINALTVYGRIKLNLIKADTCKLVINADGNLHETVLSTVDKGVLSLELTSRIISKKKFELTFYIDTLNTITLMERSKIDALGAFETDTLRLELNDNSQLVNFNGKSLNTIINTYDNSKLEGTLASNRFSLNTNGSSRALVNIKSDSVNCNSNEHSKIKLIGTAKEGVFKVNESSQIDSKDCITNILTVICTENSKVSALTKEKLTIQASDKSEIVSYGVGQITLEKFTDNAILRKKD